jgi:hypothetical protein
MVRLRSSVLLQIFIVKKQKAPIIGLVLLEESGFTVIGSTSPFVSLYLAVLFISHDGVSAIVFRLLFVRARYRLVDALSCRGLSFILEVYAQNRN